MRKKENWEEKKGKGSWRKSEKRKKEKKANDTKGNKGELKIERERKRKKE